MADEEEDKKSSGILKYRFLEEFENSIDPKTGEPYKNIDSPKVIETELFGKVELHRIARVNVTKTKVTQEYVDRDFKGRVSIKTKEVEVLVYEPSAGELGGWIEKKANLSQDGKCWVAEDAVVLGEAFVSGDAQISGEVEIGGSVVVRGKASVSGRIGLHGKVIVEGDADVSGNAVNGKKRFAADGTAVIKGKVSELGTINCGRRVQKPGDKEKPFKQYGLPDDDKDEKLSVIERAKIGDGVYIDENGEVYGEAMVYGNAYVNGKVCDKSSVYGDAFVEGMVTGNAKVCGSAWLGEGGEVTDDITFRRGVSFGQIRGYATINWMEFTMGSGSVLTFLNKDEERPKETTDKQRGYYLQPAYNDPTYERSQKIQIGENCTVSYCSFGGAVLLGDGVTATDSILMNCRIKDSRLNIARIVNAVLDGCELEEARAECTSIRGVRLTKSHIYNFIIPESSVYNYTKDRWGENWSGGSSGVSDGKTVLGVGFGSGVNKVSVTPLVYNKYDSNAGYGATEFLRKKTDEEKEAERKKAQDERQAVIDRYDARHKYLDDIMYELRKKGEDWLKGDYDFKQGIWFTTTPYRVAESVVSSHYSFLTWYTSDEIWEKIKAAVDQTFASANNFSVTPCYAFQEKEFQDKYKHDIPDFTKPTTLPTITACYAWDYMYVVTKDGYAPSLYTREWMIFESFKAGDNWYFNNYIKWTADEVSYDNMSEEKRTELYGKKEDRDERIFTCYYPYDPDYYKTVDCRDIHQEYLDKVEETDEAIKTFIRVLTPSDFDGRQGSNPVYPDWEADWQWIFDNGKSGNPFFSDTEEIYYTYWTLRLPVQKAFDKLNDRYDELKEWEWRTILERLRANGAKLNDLWEYSENWESETYSTEEEYWELVKRLNKEFEDRVKEERKKQEEEEEEREKELEEEKKRLEKEAKEKKEEAEAKAKVEELIEKILASDPKEVGLETKYNALDRIFKMMLAGETYKVILKSLEGDYTTLVDSLEEK